MKENRKKSRDFRNEIDDINKNESRSDVGLKRTKTKKRKKLGKRERIDDYTHATLKASSVLFFSSFYALSLSSSSRPFWKAHPSNGFISFYSELNF